MCCTVALHSLAEVLCVHIVVTFCLLVSSAISARHIHICVVQLHCTLTTQ